MLGFGAQGLQLAIRTIQQIVLVPLFISVWGQPLYRDWIVIFAAASFVPMLELGTQAYFGNLLLAHWASGDTARFHRVLTISLGVSAVIIGLACLAAVLTTLVMDWPSALGTSALSPKAAFLTLLLLSAGNLATVPQGVINTVYRARGEFSRLVNTGTLMLALETGGMAAAVLLGGSPVVTAAIYAAAIGLTWVLITLDQRRRYPDLRYGIAVPNRAELRELAATAPFYLVNSATATIVTSGPIIVLQVLAPGAAIVAFSTSRLLVGILRQITHQMAHASGVEMARQLAQNDLPALRRLFNNTGRLAGAIFGLLGGALMVGVEPFFRIWTRGEVPFEPWLFATLVAGAYLILPGQAPLTMLFYSNQPRPISIAYGGHALGGLALCAALAPIFAATGASAAMGIAEFVMLGLWLTWSIARAVDVPLGPYMATTYGMGFVSFAISTAIATAVARLIEPRTLLDLVLFGLAWGAVAAVPAVFLLLNRWQRRWLLDTLRQRVGLRSA